MCKLCRMERKAEQRMGWRVSSEATTDYEAYSRILIKKIDSLVVELEICKKDFQEAERKRLSDKAYYESEIEQLKLCLSYYEET